MSSENQALPTIGDEILHGLDEAIQYMNSHTEACKTHHIPIRNIEKKPANG